MKSNALPCKFFSMLLLILALPIATHALDYMYTSDGSTITITDYTGSGSTATIPNTISGLPVTTIAIYAFLNKSSLTSIIVPPNVNAFDQWSVRNCVNLTGIYFEGNRPTFHVSAFIANSQLNLYYQPWMLGWGATSYNWTPAKVWNLYTYTSNGSEITITGYEGSSNISSITIPNAIDGLPVTTIGINAFGNFTRLTSVTLPASVTTIEDAAFYFCSNLTSIYLEGNAPALNGSATFTGANRATVYYKTETSGWNTTYGGLATAPSDSNYIFTTTNDGVIILGYSGADGTASIPSTINGLPVIQIWNNAFKTTTHLTSVTIPASITTIGISTFSGCTSLANVILGNSITTIGSDMFSSCTSLTNVTIHSGITIIGSKMFSGCTSLSSITIPDSVTSIGSSAFSGCTSLSSITVDGANSAFSSQDGVLFNKSQTSLIQCPINKIGNYSIPDSVILIEEGAFNHCLLTNITIPNSVTSTGTAVFMDCVSLTDVTIGNSISTIEESTFTGCGNLESITFGNSVSTFGWNAFGSCLSLKTAYFKGNAPGAINSSFPRSGVTVYYLPGKTGWGSTFEGNPTELWLPRIEQFSQNTQAGSNAFGFYINWANDQEVVVEACATLSAPAWQPLKTITLSPDSHYFSDAEWTNHPVRFYRLSMP